MNYWIRAVALLANLFFLAVVVAAFAMGDPSSRGDDVLVAVLIAIIAAVNLLAIALPRRWEIKLVTAASLFSNAVVFAALSLGVLTGVVLSLEYHMYDEPRSAPWSWFSEYLSEQREAVRSEIEKQQLLHLLMLQEKSKEEYSDSEVWQQLKSSDAGQRLDLSQEDSLQVASGWALERFAEEHGSRLPATRALLGEDAQGLNDSDLVSLFKESPHADTLTSTSFDADLAAVEKWSRQRLKLDPDDERAESESHQMRSIAVERAREAVPIFGRYAGYGLKVMLVLAGPGVSFLAVAMHRRQEFNALFFRKRED